MLSNNNNNNNNNNKVLFSIKWDTFIYEKCDECMN